MAKYFFVFVIILCMGIGSCKKEEKVTNCAAWATEVSDELTAVMNTAMAYGTSQTVANCNAYKSACQAYVNVMKTFTDCVATWDPAMKSQYQAALADTEADLRALTCN